LLFFESSHWEYSSSNKEATRKRGGLERVEIKHVYPFRSDLKRMSTKAVHIDEKGRKKVVLTKGAPEIIEKLLAKVPDNYTKAYNYYTSKGYRVLALASK
jgi:magnesium-transporting ATPase (P-type)